MDSSVISADGDLRKQREVVDVLRGGHDVVWGPGELNGGRVLRAHSLREDDSFRIDDRNISPGFDDF